MRAAALYNLSVSLTLDSSPKVRGLGKEVTFLGRTGKSARITKSRQPESCLLENQSNKSV